MPVKEKPGWQRCPENSAALASQGLGDALSSEHTILSSQMAQRGNGTPPLNYSPLPTLSTWKRASAEIFQLTPLQDVNETQKV